MSTGYVYDDLFLRHNQFGHVENRSRLEDIMQILEEKQVLPRLVNIAARPATQPELESVHTPRYIEQVRLISERGGGHLDPDTYTCTDSFRAAVSAAGGMVEATLAVIDGKVNNAFALLRPPGHHAMPGRGMGFCLFNNVAIGAQIARQDRQLQRILIVDFDVHHGNGTQAASEGDPDLCFISTHQYPFYPGTGAFTDTGRGEGVGSVVNMPLSPGVGDEGFRELYERVLIPVARRFRPELILVSAGYDAHWNDPLAGMALSLAGYDWIVQTLLDLAGELCQGRIVFTLEGGYDLQVLSFGVLNTLCAMLGGEMVEDPLGPSPWPEPGIEDYVQSLQILHGVN